MFPSFEFSLDSIESPKIPVVPFYRLCHKKKGKKKKRRTKRDKVVFVCEVNAKEEGAGFQTSSKRRVREREERTREENRDEEEGSPDEG